MNANRQAANIQLYIDQLVLHGFPRDDRHRIGEAIRQELLRQLGERGIADAEALPQRASSLNAGSIQVEKGGRPEKIGIQVARAVYGSVAGQKPLGNRARGLGPEQTGAMNRRNQITR